jgi:glycosyltransferase involved in cell wall biosynthesis
VRCATGTPTRERRPVSLARSTANALTAVGTAGAVALTAHTAVNIRRMRRLPDDPSTVSERVSVLVPARNEARRITPTIRSLLAQQRLPYLEVLVLDDGSDDGTADVVRDVAAGDPRVRVLTGAPLADGWLGKPHACRQLADAATGSVLCFVDADVTLHPLAVVAAVRLLREARLDVVSPYPRQLADGTGPRLVQPLVEWSWLTTLPLGVAERSARPTLAAATGQFFVVDRGAYLRAGGHGAVAQDVLDDVALLRAVRRTGGRGVPVDGSRHATCRMYEDWDDLYAGYTKSLWRAFGGGAGSAATVAALGVLYVVPPVAAVVSGSRVGAVGYAAGVLGRMIVARTTGQPVLPDVLAHPASIAALGWLTAASWQRRRAGSLQWKGRPIR